MLRLKKPLDASLSIRLSFRAINQQAHKLPWLYVGITILISVIVYSVCVGKARAERDKALQQQVTLQEQVEQLSCAIEAQKINK